MLHSATYREDFNPLPPHGGRLLTQNNGHDTVNFNPLPPHGGRLFCAENNFSPMSFQSTPSAWRETISTLVKQALTEISIHSLRMEGDGYPLSSERERLIFQSTPSAWRETYMRLGDSFIDSAFQSTPSAWRETKGMGVGFTGFFNFNPLPPHGGRLAPSRTCGTLVAFQSTPSAWRETAKLHRKAFFISPILVQSCKKGCKRLHSAPEKMVFFEKREKNLVRNLQHLSVRL